MELLPTPEQIEAACSGVMAADHLPMNVAAALSLSDGMKALLFVLSEKLMALGISEGNATSLLAIIICRAFMIGLHAERRRAAVALLEPYQ